MSIFRDFYESTKKDFINIIPSIMYIPDVIFDAINLKIVRQFPEFYDVARSMIISRRSETHALAMTILSQLSHKYLFAKDMMDHLNEVYNDLLTKDPEYMLDSNYVTSNMVRCTDEIKSGLTEFALVINTAIQKLRDVIPKPIRKSVLREVITGLMTCIVSMVNFSYLIIPFEELYNTIRNILERRIDELKKEAVEEKDKFKEEFAGKIEVGLKITNRYISDISGIYGELEKAIMSRETASFTMMMDKYEAATRSLRIAVIDALVDMFDELLYEVAIRASGPVRRYFLGK